MDTILETIDQVDNILDEINEAFFDIPFENSAYQTEHFVIAASITPERAYRSIGLRISSRIRALQEAKFSCINHQIDLDEIDEKIASGELDKFEIRREDAKRQKAVADVQYTDKLINDAIAELNVLYRHFKALPKFTREQFEAGERAHFTERMNRDLQLSASDQSLFNMACDIDALREFEASTEQIGKIDSDQLEVLKGRLINLKENQAALSQERPVSIKAIGET